MFCSSVRMVFQNFMKQLRQSIRIRRFKGALSICQGTVSNMYRTRICVHFHRILFKNPTLNVPFINFSNNDIEG